MTNDKFRNQIMKSAVSKYGVISVAIEGPDKDQLVVTGEGVDVVNLTRSIQKKLRCATLLSVEEVEPAVEPSVEEPNNLIGTFSPMPAGYYQYPQFPKCYQVIYDQDPHYSCSIL
ncbi:hypothetical protein CJ030_MR7G001383 [Morella rubra]|uniref:HMA domain-containing protein n=1 Tax=Morella rubra TaxID=262757 RepID=A0A6A1UKB6_9ROSI|nr:hypothetical protein CJ030_MR0G006555 [Morella rubra]KAB1208414.1 hypothetical protein CJ030_MR7G001383 [Morella rubra]